MDLKESHLQAQYQAGRHPWELARQQVVARLMKQYLPASLTQGKMTVLDMGCGDSWLIEQLSPLFPQADFGAVDIAFSPEQLAAYNQHFQNNSLPISAYKQLEDWRLPEGKHVDLVLLLDVIEHIEEDISFLRYLLAAPQVGPETYFLITVPAFQQLFCEHDRFLEHYRRYDNEMLKRHTVKAGLYTREVGYFFSSLLLPRTLTVLKEKMIPPTPATGIGVWQGDEFSTNLFTQILVTDFEASQALAKVGIKLPGLSNFILCKASAS